MIGIVAINAATIWARFGSPRTASVNQKLPADAFEQSNNLPMRAAALANICDELLQNVRDYVEALR